MKRIFSIIMIGCVLLSVGCSSQNTSSISVPFKIGDARVRVISTDSMNSIFYLNTIEIFEDRDTKIVVIYDNDMLVSAYVVFSSSGNVLVLHGISPISIDMVESYHGRSLTEFQAAYGEMHCDAGSGILLPAYVTNCGMIITLGLDSNQIIRAINKISV